MNNEMRTLDDIDSLPAGDNTYKLLMNCISIQKEEALSAINKNNVFMLDDYTSVIPEGDYLYFTNAYMPNQTLKIAKNHFKKLLKLPIPRLYAISEQERQEDFATGMKFHKDYIVIAEDVKNSATKYN